MMGETTESIQRKIATLDELIEEFRENRSLWSVKQQLGKQLKEKEKNDK